MKYIDATVRDDSHLTHIQMICPFPPELVGREQGNTQRLFFLLQLYLNKAVPVQLLHLDPYNSKTKRLPQKLTGIKVS